MRRALIVMSLIAMLVFPSWANSAEPSYPHPLYRGARIAGYYEGNEASQQKGILWAAPTNTPVKAIAAGTVMSAGWQTSYGMTIVIDHGNGVKAYYAHLSRFSVVAGDKIAQSQVIGFSGNTGASAEPSLYFEIWVNGKAVDPLTFSFENVPAASKNSLSASHFKKEPLGMDGWAWGTDLSSVAGYLVLEDNFTGIPGARVYSRTDRDDCSFLGGGWQTVFQFFKNNKFVGVFCGSRQQYISIVVDYFIVETLGEPAVDETSGSTHVMIWSGENAAVLYLGTNDEDSRVMVFVGLKTFIAEVLLALTGTPLPQ